MSTGSTDDWQQGLPTDVVAVLQEFTAISRETFRDSLKAVVLFGSAAEGRLRATSDVNLLLVFERVDLDLLADWRGSVTTLAAAIELKPMMLLLDEIAGAAEAFAVKYFDILHRRRVLYGPDPFVGVTIGSEALQRRVSQVLLNLTLQLRHALFMHNDAGQTHALVDAIGPLRAVAAVGAQLRNDAAAAPREALIALAARHGASETLERIQQLREQGDPVAPDAAQLLASLIEFVRALSVNMRINA